MNKVEIKNYIEENYSEKVNEIKEKIEELLSHIPSKYKLKDKVYFIEKRFKSSRNRIKCRQYRSARKIKDTLLFPTHELAFEYFKVTHWEMFSFLTNIIDSVFPKYLEEQINNFAEVRDINFGETKEFKISHRVY